MTTTLADPSARFRLDDKVALVTGASSGIGARLVEVYTAAGATVYAAARRRDRLEALAERTGAVPVVCDVAVEDDCQAAVDQVVGDHGTIDVLVNCAGVSTIAKAEDETRDMFARTVEVNLTGTYSMSRLAGTTMVSKGSGSIVNVASIVGLVGLGRMPQAGYAASKAGVVNLTRELAAQWARKGVRVNAIAPAFFDTEMTEGLFDGGKGEEWVASLTPMGRGGRVDELDGAALFLASDISSYVTGITIPVDGGWTAV